MSDVTTKTTGDDDTDPLQSNRVIEEAFQVSDNDARSESEEGWAVEALSRSFEDYVRNYQDSWQQAWQESIVAYEQDVKNWQNIITDFQSHELPVAQRVQAQPAPQTSPPQTSSAPKTKPKKSGS